MTVIRNRRDLCADARERAELLRREADLLEQLANYAEHVARHQLPDVLADNLFRHVNLDGGT